MTDDEKQVLRDYVEAGEALDHRYWLTERDTIRWNTAQRLFRDTFLKSAIREMKKEELQKDESKLPVAMRNEKPG